MDLVQTLCRKAATSSARPSLLALRTPITAPRSHFSTSRRLFAAQPPRPPPEPSEAIDRLRKSLHKNAFRRSPNSLFGGPPIENLGESIMKDADMSLAAFSKDEFLASNLRRTEVRENLRLRPVTGRTANVRAGDVVGAFASLEMRVRANSVRRDHNSQLYHERPALKRKRKLRERWRARFRGGVAAAIKRTLSLKAQGW